jgi:hypothetical protein
LNNSIVVTQSQSGDYNTVNAAAGQALMLLQTSDPGNTTASRFYHNPKAAHNRFLSSN